MAREDDVIRECVECRELLQLIADELDGELAAETRAEVMMHIHECSDCARMVQSFKRVVLICHSQPGVDVPTVVHEEFWQVIRREIRSRREARD